jgi:hypothetical protein
MSAHVFKPLTFDRGKFVQLGLSNFTAFEVAEVVLTCSESQLLFPSGSDTIGLPLVFDMNGVY